MNHEEVRGALGAYMDGELDPPRRAAVEAHLAGCAACRAELDLLASLDRTLAEQPVPEPGDHYWARFADRVAERTAPAMPSGARFYERLTGWLFPNERFAWVRAATAVAACTLLVTLGLHGFRSIETRSRAPLGTGAPPSESPHVSEIGLPPEASSESKELDLAEKPEPTEPATSDEVRQPATHPEAQPPGAASKSTETRPQVARPAPVPESEPELEVAPPSRDPAASKARSTERAARGEPKRKAEPASPTPVLDEAPAAPRVAKGMGRLAPVAQEQLDSLAAPRLFAMQPDRAPGAAVRLDRDALSTEASPALVESLLARDARLWPRRDEPEFRPRLEALATELARYPDDPRARERARAYLEHLAATSPTGEERERWERMLGLLPER